MLVVGNQCQRTNYAYYQDYQESHIRISPAVGGKTIGRHYAGPSWEHSDGSAVAAKVSASAPGATANDIAWLKLDVTSRRGSGILADITTVQRINTHGGKRDGACD